MARRLNITFYPLWRNFIPKFSQGKSSMCFALKSASTSQVASSRVWFYHKTLTIGMTFVLSSFFFVFRIFSGFSMEDMSFWIFSFLKSILWDSSRMYFFNMEMWNTLWVELESSVKLPTSLLHLLFSWSQMVQHTLELTFQTY